MRESKRIRLMNLKERVGRLRVEELPPKESCIVCEEVSQGVIDELIELQVDAKNRKQTLEFYYNLILQQHVADPRTDEELKESYRKLALDSTLDPIIRANCVKYFLALEHHLSKERADRKLPCRNYQHSYEYVGGTATTLNFKCKYCGDRMSSTSVEYLSAEGRRCAIKRFTGERDVDEVVSAEPPQECNQECSHDWRYVGGKPDAIYFTCSKCGDKMNIKSPKLVNRNYRIKQISRYDDRAYLNLSSDGTKLCLHSWEEVERTEGKVKYKCNYCDTTKTIIQGALNE